MDRGKASITAEQLTAAQQAVQRAIRGLSHDASKPKARVKLHDRRMEPEAQRVAAVLCVLFMSDAAHHCLVHGAQLLVVVASVVVHDISS